MLHFANIESDRNRVVSSLAQIEARSGIVRLWKGKLLTPSQASLALDALAAEMKRIVEQPVNPTVLEAASGFIDRHNLRTLDAVQLGSAVVARDLLGSPDMRFISSDADLLDAAEAEGFSIWNPLISG